LFSFVKFLVAQNLARVEYSDCLLDWLEREMHPHFVAALTPRGRQLVELIHENEKELASRGVFTSSGNYHVAQEGIFKMDLITKWPRFDMIQNFQDSFKATK
jgi:hypothetical protein